eukprot:scaffold12693_cov142-Isochrysis_galbana.AAC.6
MSPRPRDGRGAALLTARARGPAPRKRCGTRGSQDSQTGVCRRPRRASGSQPARCWRRCTCVEPAPSPWDERGGRDEGKGLGQLRSTGAG